MAEITRQRIGEIIRAVFEVLQEHPDGLQVRQVMREVEARLPITEFEKSDYPNRPGVRRFDKIIRFATITPVKAGWMTKSRAGLWTITDEGRVAYRTFADPTALAKEAIRLYGAWKKSQPIEEGEEDEAPEVDDATATATLEEAQESAWSEIEQYLGAMPPYEFQDLVSALLRAMGYFVSWVAPPGPDRGIDIVAFTDPLGTQGPRVKVQVKRSGGRIGVDGLRAFLAVLAERDVGVFVSLGGFTGDAVGEARMQETRRLNLIDAERLVELWVEHYDKLSEVDRQRLPLTPVYFLATED